MRTSIWPRLTQAPTQFALDIRSTSGRGSTFFFFPSNPIQSRTPVSLLLLPLLLLPAPTVYVNQTVQRKIIEFVSFRLPFNEILNKSLISQFKRTNPAIPDGRFAIKSRARRAQGKRTGCNLTQKRLKFSLNLPEVLSNVY